MRRNGVKNLTTALVLGGALTALLPNAAQAQSSTYPQTQRDDPRNPSSRIERMGSSARAGQLKSDDYEFVTKASQIDLEEVQMGELAQSRGTSAQVRSFGERMVRDHGKSSAKLQELATQKGATVPAQLSQRENSRLQHMEGLSGAEFDRAFAEHMVKGHTRAIKEYRSAVKEISDPELRTFAETSLPTLQEHLQMAKELESSLKKEK